MSVGFFCLTVQGKKEASGKTAKQAGEVTEEEGGNERIDSGCVKENGNREPMMKLQKRLPEETGKYGVGTGI